MCNGNWDETDKISLKYKACQGDCPLSGRVVKSLFICCEVIFVYVKRKVGERTKPLNINMTGFSREWAQVKKLSMHFWPILSWGRGKHTNKSLDNPRKSWKIFVMCFVVRRFVLR